MNHGLSSSGLSPLLRPYQREGVSFLTSADAALLADEMGTGKTVMVAQALRVLRDTYGLRRTLVVAPAALLTNWQRELARWGPDVATRSTHGLSAKQRAALWALPVPIVVASYEALRADFLLRSPRGMSLDLVVFDEAQRLKNRQAETTIAARRVPARLRWALSATPLENGVADLASLAEVLRLARPADLEAAPQVLSALRGRFLRRRKRDVVDDMPAFVDMELPLSMGAEQRREYDGLADGGDLAGASTTELLALITRLKQVCNHGSDGDSVKLDALLTLLDDPGLGEAKVLVVSQYTSTLDWLIPRLPVPCLRYAGDMRTVDREASLGGFRDRRGPLVMLMSLKAGGVGLNLPEASHVVLFDRWWNRAAEDQAVARADRLGRSGTLLAYRFQVEDTVEDRILELSSTRGALFDSLVEGDLAAASGRLSRADLLAVLAPSRVGQVRGRPGDASQ